MMLIDKLFLFHQANRVYTHILYWLGVWLVTIANDNYRNREDWTVGNSLSYYGLALITQLLTAYFIAYLIIPLFFKTKKYALIILYFVTGMYLICVLSRGITIYIREPMAGIQPKNDETIVDLFVNSEKLFQIYFFRNLSVAIVFLFLKVLVDQFTAQKRAFRLEKEKAELKLKFLKSQLNPHFLFNTLNNIYSLSLMQSPATSDSIARLAALLDYVLYQCSRTYVPLASEIILLTNYIELEKLRYDDRLVVTFTRQVDHPIEIGPLILLSLVENAFKHGAGNDMGSPTIHIDLRVSDTLFSFCVVNSIPTQESNGLTEKIGLSNLKQQLQLLYGSTYNLHLEQANGLFTVTLLIQLNSVTHTYEEHPVSVS